MYTFEDIGKILDEICEEIPKPFFELLNGGINLLPDAKMHEASVNNDLYVLGEYRRDALGRYINIYFGSIKKNYPNQTAEQLRPRLKQLLLHEFTHHIEALAGERGLEIRDAQRISEYRNQENTKNHRRPLARRRSQEPEI